MDNLYKKHFENLLFERKILYMSKTPKGSPGGAIKSPKSNVDAPPTAEEVQQKAVEAKESIDENTKGLNAKEKNTGKKFPAIRKKINNLNKRLLEIQKSLKVLKKQKRLQEAKVRTEINNRLDDLLADSYEESSPAVVFKALVENVSPSSISSKATSPNSAVNYPKGIDPTKAKSKPGSKVESKEVKSKYKVSIGDVVNHKIKVLQDHLYNFVQGMKKRTKMSTSQIKLSSEYKEISKVISESQKQVSKISKMKIKKEPEYKKVNVKIKAVAEKYNVDVPAYKPPTAKTVLALIKDMRANLKNIADPKLRKASAQRLKNEEAYIIMISNPNDKTFTQKEKPKILPKIFTDKTKMLRKWQTQYNLQEDPFHKGIDAGATGKPKGGSKSAAKRAVGPKLSSAEQLKQNNDELSAEIDYKIKYLDGVLKAKRGGAEHEAAMKASPEYRDAYDNLQTIKKIKKKIDSQKDPKKRNVHLKELNSKIDEEAKRRKITIPPNPDTAPKTPSTPIAGPAKLTDRELAGLSENERDLVKGLRDLEHGTGNFETTMGTVNRLIKRMGKRMGIRPGNDVNKISTQALPDGYEVGMINWPKSKGKNYDSYPNLVIYRNGKIICFRTGTSETGTSLQTPAQASPRDLKVVQIIKGHAVINNLRSKNSTEVKGSMKLNSVAKMEELKTTLRDFARSAVMPSSTRFGYGLVIDAGGTSVYFKNKGGGHGEFKIRMGQSVYFYDTQGDKIGTAKFDKKGKVIDKGYSNELGVMSKNEKKVLDNKRETAKKAKEKAAKFKKERFETTSSLREPNSKLIKYDKEKGNEFTVKTKSTTPNIAEKKFLKQKINGVINFNRVLDKFLYITIKGAQNRPERKALYTPGSKTAYVLKNGVMTSKRVRFYNGDRFKLEYKEPNFRSVKEKHRKVVRERMEVGKRMKQIAAGRVKKGIDKRKMGALKRFMTGTPARAMRGKTNRRKFIALADQVISTENTTKKKQKPKATKG